MASSLNRAAAHRLLEIAGFLQRLVPEIDDDLAALERRVVELALGRRVGADAGHVRPRLEPVRRRRPASSPSSIVTTRSHSATASRAWLTGRARDTCERPLSISRANASAFAGVDVEDPDFGRAAAPRAAPPPDSAPARPRR